MATTQDHQLQSDRSLVKTLDSNGNIVNGVYRTADGGLVVKNQTAYAKYLKEKEQHERMQKLESEMSDIKSMLKILIEKQNG